MTGNPDIEIRILRSKRRSVVGRVLPDGNIEVRAPLTMTTDEISKFLDRYEPEFLPVVDECRRVNAYVSKHPFGYGGEVMLLGEWVPIKVVEDNKVGYMAIYKDGAVVVQPGQSEERLRYFISDLFSNLAIPLFDKKLQFYSQLMGVQHKSWTVGNARKRHGSCDSNGKITLSWHIVMMAESVIEYIIVHELAHLKHMNHAKGFKDEVASVLPDWKERKKTHGDQGLILRACGWL